MPNDIVTNEANDVSAAVGKVTIPGSIAFTEANDSINAHGWAGLIEGTIETLNEDDSDYIVGYSGATGEAAAMQSICVCFAPNLAS